MTVGEDSSFRFASFRMTKGALRMTKEALRMTKGAL
jgi:hypothetical protein